eukprot:gene3916-4170_t
MFEGLVGALLLDSDYLTVSRALQPWVAEAFQGARAAAGLSYLPLSNSEYGSDGLEQQVRDLLTWQLQQVQNVAVGWLGSSTVVSDAQQAAAAEMEQTKAVAEQQQQLLRRPTVIGGAVQSISGSGHSSLDLGSYGVSLLAASLPGVRLLPFHVSKPSLPSFSAEEWAMLLQQQQQEGKSGSSTYERAGSQQAGAADAASHNSAIVLSTPFFFEVQEFLQRLGNILPGMPAAAHLLPSLNQIVGGVTEKDAWLDTENSYGALFCNQEVHCTGAVGCIFHGPLVMRQMLLPACRPAGDIMTVTESDETVVYKLDEVPVHNSVCMSLAPSGLGQPVMVVNQEVPVGAQVQLQVTDFQNNLVQQQQGLKELAHRLSRVLKSPPAAASGAEGAEGPDGEPSPPATPPAEEEGGATAVSSAGGNGNQAATGAKRSTDPVAAAGAAASQGLKPEEAEDLRQQFALLGYCCVELPHDEAALVQQLVPQVPFAGGRMSGEIAGRCCPTNLSAGTAASAAVSTPAAPEPIGAQLHSICASYVLLCHSDIAAHVF